MKEIIYNNYNLKDSDINKEVKRARALIANSRDELLFGYSDNTYQTIGGHLEEGETYLECLSREIKEESGIELTFDNIEPFVVIKYYQKDYPEKGKNTLYIINYYLVRTDIKPDLSKIDLTDDELAWNYEVRYIPKDICLKELYDNIALAKKKLTVYDTIEVVLEYLKITNN